MHPHNRTKLVGTYRTPRFKYGATVTCAIRGEVQIVGLSNGRIPWPKSPAGKRARAIILYGQLAEAVRRESAAAVAHWFGVGMFTVWTWRKALGVDRVNEGTSALMSRWSPDTIQSGKARRKLAKALKRPERAAKIAAAKTGKSRPRHVIEAMREANIGRKLSAEHPRESSSAAAWPRRETPASRKSPPRSTSPSARSHSGRANRSAQKATVTASWRARWRRYCRACCGLLPRRRR
jgi:hypothetical protein